MLLTLSDIREEVRTRLRKSGLGSAQIDRWVNMAQAQVLTEVDSDHLFDETTFTTAADTRVYYIDAEFNRILSLVNESQHYELTEESQGYLESVDPGRIHTGTAESFAQLAPTWVLAQPSAASTITVVSSNSGDTSQKIRVLGVVSGVERTELLTLNGTTDVTGTLSFTTITQITKDSDTSGVITATSNSGAVTLVTLSPRERAHNYQPIALYPIPSGTDTMRVRFIRNPRELVNSEDHPDVPERYHELVVIGAVIIGHQSYYHFDQARLIKNEVWEPFMEKFKKEQGNSRRKKSPVLLGHRFSSGPGDKSRLTNGEII